MLVMVVLQCGVGGVGVVADVDDVVGRNVGVVILVGVRCCW